MSPQKYQNGTYVPDQLTEYENYVYETVRRYRTVVKNWEIRFDLNWSSCLPQPDSKAYTRLLEAARRGIERADPNARVVGPSLNLINFDFIDAVFQRGAGAFMDIISIEPYSSAPEFKTRNHMATLRALMEKYGVRKPIWVTETGFAVAPDGVDELTQARYLVRLYVLFLSLDVERIFWVNFRNDIENPVGNTVGFGILTHEFTPKPAYHAFAVMTRKLEGLEYAQSLASEPLEVHRFVSGTSKRARKVIVAWTSGEDTSFEIPVDARVIRMTSLLGDVKEVHTENGRVRLRLTSAPIYIESF